ncbi:MAG: hypothetical protein ACKOF3_08045 [Spartobacteria bacterium]
MRIAWHAAISAKYFRKNTGDPRCLGELEAYYRIVQHGTERPLDTRELARLELQWWKERRLNIPQQDYARTVARLTGLLYGVGENKALPAADLRTRAMVYRDARRDGRMREADWMEVERQLTQAYALLKRSCKMKTVIAQLEKDLPALDTTRVKSITAWPWIIMSQL